MDTSTDRAWVAFFSNRGKVLIISTVASLIFTFFLMREFHFKLCNNSIVTLNDSLLMDDEEADSSVLEVLSSPRAVLYT